MSENVSGTHVLCSVFISSPARLHHMDWCTCSTPPAGAHLWPLQLLYLEHMLGKVTALTANGFGTLQQSHWTVSFPLELKGFPRVIKPQGACHGCPEKQENSPYMTCTHTHTQSNNWKSIRQLSLPFSAGDGHFIVFACQLGLPFLICYTQNKNQMGLFLKKLSCSEFTVYCSFD